MIAVPSLRRAGDGGRGAEQDAGEAAQAGIRLRLLRPAEMAAGDVAGLVRDHAGQLVRVGRCG